MLRFISQYGRPGITFSMTSTDAAQGIPANKLTNNGRNLCAMLVDCDENPIKLAFGVDPVPGAGGIGHWWGFAGFFGIGMPNMIVGESACANFRFCSYDEGEECDTLVTITPFYAG